MTRLVATLIVILYDMVCLLRKSTVNTKCLSTFLTSSDLLLHTEAEMDNGVDTTSAISATLLRLEGIVQN